MIQVSGFNPLEYKSVAYVLVGRLLTKTYTGKGIFIGSNDYGSLFIDGLSDNVIYTRKGLMVIFKNSITLKGDDAYAISGYLYLYWYSLMI